jgi:hypothetical protein
VDVDRELICIPRLDIRETGIHLMFDGREVWETRPAGCQSWSIIARRTNNIVPDLRCFREAQGNAFIMVMEK